MKSKWQLTTLGKIVKLKSGGTPRKSEPKYWNGNIPWVSSGEMGRERIRETQLKVTEEGSRNGTKLAPKHSIFMVVRGMSLAKEFRVCLGMNPLTFNQDVKAIFPNKNINSIFLFYYLKSQANAIRDSASEAAHGTKKLDTAVLDQWVVPLPPSDVQKRIAAILTAYDDEIELNKHRINLLENMAQEIYREWFIRFRFPGNRSNGFRQGVPNGWEIKPLRGLVKFYIGGGWGSEVKTPVFSEEAFVIRGTDIPSYSKGNFSTKTLRYHSLSNLATRKLQRNDIIFETSGGSKNQPLGRSLIVTEGLLSYFRNNLICASFCKLVRFNETFISPFLIKYFLKELYKSKLICTYQTQSTGISNFHFENFLDHQTYFVPSERLQNDFECIVKPLIKQQDSLALQNIKLNQTKNLLLPRLMSGKLSVEDLDIQFPPSMKEETTP